MKPLRSLLIVLLILLVQACRITQVVPEGGAVVSSSGLHDCQAGETCVIELSGVGFSDTFTAIAARGIALWVGSRFRVVCVPVALRPVN